MLNDSRSVLVQIVYILSHNHTIMKNTSRIHAFLTKQSMNQKYSTRAIYCKQENYIFFLCVYNTHKRMGNESVRHFQKTT
jgi:hypothetical protein